MSSRRVILLGASNLQLGLPLLLENLARQSPADAEHLEVWTAAGHGRSYGRWSRVFVRELPGIIDCRLWEDLEASSVVPEQTYGLVTDIGNDILYGISPERIMDWVRRVVERLSKQNARIVATGLPLGSVRAMSPWKFRMMRQILFPASRLTLSQTLSLAEELHGRVSDLAAEFSAPLIVPEDCWYGFDPIHIQGRSRLDAWQKVLGPWEMFSENVRFSGPGSVMSRHVRRALPYEQRLLGRQKITPQPVVKSRTDIGFTWSVY